jgi:hypothetical protein
MSEPTLTVTSDFTAKFKESIKQFQKDVVLVGIPQEDGPREEGAPINNATLLAINNYGSPANNIPPRPVMQIGIRNAQEAIAEQFKIAAQTVLSKGGAAIGQAYERAGMIASNSIKKAINDQEGIEPPSDATLKARKYIGKSGFKGNKALVVTGQMRNAITYVVKSVWGS